MTIDEIEKKLYIMLKKLRCFGNEILNDNAILTGENCRVSAEELMYFLYQIERDFNIKMEEVDFINYKFSSIASIAKSIKKHLDGGAEQNARFV